MKLKLARTALYALLFPSVCVVRANYRSVQSMDRWIVGWIDRSIDQSINRSLLQRGFYLRFAVQRCGSSDFGGEPRLLRRRDGLVVPELAVCSTSRFLFSPLQRFSLSCYSSLCILLDCVRLYF